MQHSALKTDRRSGSQNPAEPGISTVTLQDQYKVAKPPLLSEELFQTKANSTFASQYTVQRCA